MNAIIKKKIENKYQTIQPISKFLLTFARNYEY